MDTLEIHTLGGLLVVFGGQPVKGLNSRRVQAMLVYLACTQQTCPRQNLADLFWPDHPRTRSLANLRRALSDLRRKVPGALVITRQSVGINLQQPYWIDVHEFEAVFAPLVDDHPIERMEERITLYKGDFLYGFSIESEEFEDWLMLERERLRLQAVAGLDRIIEYRESLGHLTVGIEYGKKLLQLDVLRERSHRHLMRLLYKAGERSTALAQYQTCADLLMSELGVMPDAETVAMADRIRSDGHLRPRPIRQVQHNLPAQMTRFVGRQAEVQELAEQLGHDPHCRLITLIGPGGVGKTRLALKLAQDLLAHFEDGVYWVDLTALHSQPSLINAIASSLKITFALGEDSPRQQLLAHLGPRDLLLVLDNGEHLTHMLAEFVSSLLAETVHVKILLSSREALQIGWEWLKDVKGLDVPQRVDQENLLGYDAVRLFLERAKHVRRDFRLAGNSAVVVQICQAVDGLPLGIELAAGWLRSMSCADVLAALDELESVQQAVPRRQRSLRLLVEDTWARLSDSDRRTLCQLSVFRGSFGQEAAAAVAQCSVPRLAVLVNKSLIQVDHEAGRYHLHLLLRRFLTERLEDNLELSHKANAGHARYFASFLRDRGQYLVDATHKRALVEIETEIENIRPAWQWVVQHPDLVTLEVIGNGLFMFYTMRGWHHEAIWLLRWSLDALEKHPSTPELIAVRLNLLIQLSTPLMTLHGYAASEVGEVCQQARDLAALAGRTPQLGKVLLALSAYYNVRADLKTTEELAQDSLELAVELGDPILMLQAHVNCNMTYTYTGEYEKAIFHANEISAQYDPLRHHSLAGLMGADPAVVALGRASASYWHLGYPDQAVKYMNRSLEIAQDLNHPFSEAISYAYSLLVWHWCGYMEQVDHASGALWRICEEHDFAFFMAIARIVTGMRAFQVGMVEEGLAQFEAGFMDWRATDALLGLTVFNGYHVEICLQMEQYDRGFELVQNTIDWQERTGERWVEPQAHILRGRLLQATGKPTAAQHAYEKAIFEAQRRDARSWELRAAMRLAHLWHGQGRVDEALGLLRPVFDWFTEDFETGDQMAARALLAQLASERGV